MSCPCKHTNLGHSRTSRGLGSLSFGSYYSFHRTKLPNCSWTLVWLRFGSASHCAPAPQVQPHLLLWCFTRADVLTELTESAVATGPLHSQLVSFNQAEPLALAAFLEKGRCTWGQTVLLKPLTLSGAIVPGG